MDESKTINLKDPPKERDFFNRVGHIEIDFGEQSDGIRFKKGQFYRFDGVDFKFKVTKVISNYPQGMMDISILGLNEETRNSLMLIETQGIARRKNMRLRLYAGYDKSGESDGDLLIECDVIYATVVSPPPEIWMNIVGVIGNTWRRDYLSLTLPDKLSGKHGVTERWDGFEGGNGDVIDFTDAFITNASYAMKAFSLCLYAAFNWSEWGKTKKNIVDTLGKEANLGEVVKIKQYTLIDLCNDIVRKYNEIKEVKESGIHYELDFRAPDAFKKRPVLQFNFSGDMVGLLEHLNRTQRYIIFYLEMRDDAITGEKREFIVVDLCPWKKSYEDTPIPVDEEHGMVGVPSIVEGQNLRGRTLLNPSISPRSLIEVTSKLIPQLNGKWVVRSVTYTGHFRGNEWYTDFEAFDPKRIEKSAKGK